MKKLLLVLLALPLLFSCGGSLDKDQTDKEYFNKAEDYAANGKYQLAIDNYTKCLKLDLDDANKASAYNNRGLAYRDLGNYTAAIADYNSALKINPDYASAYNNRGNAYYDLENYTAAIADYTSAIKITIVDLSTDSKYYDMQTGQPNDEISSYIQEYCDKINEQCPIMIDARTELIGAIYSNPIYLYKLKIKDFESDEASDTILQVMLEEEKIKLSDGINSPSKVLSLLRKKGLNLGYIYEDINGKQCIFIFFSVNQSGEFFLNRELGNRIKELSKR